MEIGDKVEPFCLPNQDQEEICFRDIKGSWIVLYFYPKDSTPGCTTEACDFTDKKADFDAQGALVMGVSPDSPQRHRNFIEKKALSIMLLSDEEKELSMAFGVWRLKKNYGREYMGIVRSTYIIDPEGKVAYAWNNVRVKGHVEAVYEKLKELMS